MCHLNNETDKVQIIILCGQFASITQVNWNGKKLDIFVQMPIRAIYDWV